MVAVTIDHYKVLGLPSGIEGTKLATKDITKAFKLKALVLHPDKRPNDPNAATKFRELRSSYEILLDEKTRKDFDLNLIYKSKRTRAQYDREERLRKAREQRSREKRLWEALYESEMREAQRKAMLQKKKMEELKEQKRKEEIERIAKAAKLDPVLLGLPIPPVLRDILMGEMVREILVELQGKAQNRTSTVFGVDKERVLKISWDGHSYYSARRLRDLFEQFGHVEDVAIRSRSLSKMRSMSTAVVVMASKDGATAALKGNGNARGDRPNHLLVLAL